VIGSSPSDSHRFLGAGLDTSEGRSFLRERLALEGKMVFVLGAVFWIALGAVSGGLGLVGLMPPLSWRSAVFHGAGMAVMGFLWLAARRSGWRIRSLGLLDAVALILSCWCWAFMMAGTGHSVAGALLAGLVTVIARSVVVPSSAARTFWLSLAALAPMAPVSYFLGAPTASPAYPFPPTVGAVLTAITSALWAGVAVATATMTSRVIYGLRQRVKQANELGQYRLEERIGAGGMGEVWRAHHRLLIRPAAIKLIRPEALGSSTEQPDLLHRRFELEARATAGLRSPHTVQLYDFGVGDDGTLYYVMELLEGFNADELVRKFGPMPAERAVHILEHMCCSLADAHRHGLVHRDVKPANVFVSRQGLGGDFAKVLDFGLVKLDRSQDDKDALRLTAAGMTTGTPAFMAPEMVLGLPVDHRVDIYAFGCVAYWLLTGHLVFDGSAATKVMLDHAQTPPTPPSRRGELAIPADLEQLVLDCLEKDPADRPQSARELAARLAACRHGRDEWTPERAERWWGAHAPAVANSRPFADILLSHEGHAPVAHARA
jgi:serine/threonine-protein kinase